MTISSAYIGDALLNLYNVLFGGNEVIAKGAAALITGINKKKYLPLVSQTANPIGTYTTGQPGADTVTTAYSERYLEPEKMMVYEDINPDLFLSVWEKWQGVGDLTNYAANPEFLNDVLNLYRNNYGTQLSSLFWQGNKTGGVAELEYFNGIIPRAIADGNVIATAVNGSGNITKENVADILEAVWAAIPDKMLNDPAVKIHMNTGNWKMLQQYNNSVKKGTVGVLNEVALDLFLGNKVEHYAGFPANYMLAAKSSVNENESNLVFGCYVNPEEETPKIMLKVPAGKIYFVRVDFMADANYKVGSELVLYQP